LVFRVVPLAFLVHTTQYWCPIQILLQSIRSYKAPANVFGSGPLLSPCWRCPSVLPFSLLSTSRDSCTGSVCRYLLRSWHLQKLSNRRCIKSTLDIFFSALRCALSLRPLEFFGFETDQSLLSALLAKYLFASIPLGIARCIGKNSTSSKAEMLEFDCCINSC